MGLGLHIRADLPRYKLFGKVVTSTELFAPLSDAFRELLPGQLQKVVFAAATCESQLSLQLHPCEKPIELEIENNSLICSATTNSAGPGYHAFLVEALESIGARLGLSWQWDDQDDEYGDHTGYHDHRNFALLQDKMLLWLRTLVRTFTENERSERLRISIPEDYSIAGEYDAASALGFWDRDWLEELAGSEIEQIREQGRAFFPWWEKGFGAEFWYKCGLAKAWVELPWHTFTNLVEERDFNFVIACFNKALALEPSIVLPENEIREIEKYLDPNKLGPSPHAGGIGYRRGLMERKLTGCWTVELPGYYYDEIEDEGSTAVYYFGGRVIRGSSFSTDGGEGKPVDPKSLLEEKPKDCPVFELEHDNLEGWAEIRKISLEGRDYWILNGKTAAANNVCHVTISFITESDMDWAIQTWRSIARPRLRSGRNGTSPRELFPTDQRVSREEPPSPSEPGYPGYRCSVAADTGQADNQRCPARWS